MQVLLETAFNTKAGAEGRIITCKRPDGLYVTTFEPRLGLDFHSMDTDKTSSHETVKHFLQEIKGCTIQEQQRSS